MAIPTISLQKSTPREREVGGIYPSHPIIARISQFAFAYHHYFFSCKTSLSNRLSPSKKSAPGYSLARLQNRACSSACACGYGCGAWDMGPFCARHFYEIEKIDSVFAARHTLQSAQEPGIAIHPTSWLDILADIYSIDKGVMNGPIRDARYAAGWDGSACW